MQTLESLLKKGTTILKDNGVEEAGLDAWLLLEFKTGKNRAYYFAHGDEPVSDETAAEYLTLIVSSDRLPLLPNRLTMFWRSVR